VSTILEGSRLNPQRLNTSDIFDSHSEQLDLNITEAALNELLTNITFSLVALNLWTDNITVNATFYQNTYAFSRPINLVLPYALCLAFGLAIVVLGLSALWQNGVPATEGFMQIMMATRGPTEMEGLVRQHELIDAKSASKELKSLRVRYGGLVLESGVEGKRMWGFGTAEETVSLRKRREW
jgi:hypothetical protein